MRSKLIADVSVLSGRHFVATSKNVCQLSMAGEGWLRAVWDNDPSPEDAAECDRWAGAILNARMFSVIGIQNEAEAVEGFRKRFMEPA